MECVETKSIKQSKGFSEKEAYYFLLFEGIASIAIQALIIRQVIPFTGSNIFATSITLGVYLGALAISYYIGGRVKENHEGKIKVNLLLTSVIFGIGTSYLFVSYYFELFFSLSDNPYLGLFIYCLIIEIPIVLLVGQFVPLLINFIRNGSTAQITGDSFHSSTWGNAIGMLFTTLILMTLFGVGWAIVFNSALFSFLALYIALKNGDIRTIVPVTLILFGVLFVNVIYGKFRFVETTAYSNYEIIEQRETTYLKINNQVSGMIKEDGSTLEYIDAMRKHISSADDYQKILVLGAGGFTLTNGNSSDFREYTYIDIDPNIKEIAEEHFLKDKVQDEFIAADARSYLFSTEDKWDVIVLDVYSNPQSVPLHLVTKEFYSQVKSHLNSNGVLLANVIGSLDMKDTYSQRMDRTLRSVFEFCRSEPMQVQTGPINIVYSCYPNEVIDSVVYVDDSLMSGIDSAYLAKK